METFSVIVAPLHVSCGYENVYKELNDLRTTKKIEIFYQCLKSTNLNLGPKQERVYLRINKHHLNPSP